MRIWIIAAAAFAISNQASAQEIEVPRTDANVYIYRDHAQPTIWSPTVKIDGKKVVALGEDQYTAIRLEPGEHQIKLVWPIFSGQSGRSGKIVVREGETLYIEITGTSRYLGGYPMMTSLMGSGLTLRQEAAAEVRACCRFKPPK